MKKLLIILLFLTLLFQFCGKDSGTEAEVEDRIEVTISVTQNGQPLSGGSIKIQASVKTIIDDTFNTGTGGATSITASYTKNIASQGSAEFVFVNQSFSSEKHIIIKKIEVFGSAGKIGEDTNEHKVKTNTEKTIPLTF